jgi:hypothetical protein
MLYKRFCRTADTFLVIPVLKKRPFSTATRFITRNHTSSGYRRPRLLLLPPPLSRTPHAHGPGPRPLRTIRPATAAIGKHARRAIRALASRRGPRRRHDRPQARPARVILSYLRQAADNFKRLEAWQTSAFLNDHSAAYPASYQEFEAEFGLPEGIDLNAPLEVAFPPPEPAFSDLSSRAETAASAGGAEGPGFSPGGPRFPSFERAPLFPDIPAPYVRDYNAEAEAAFEATPEDMELNEILKEQGYKAMERRAREHQRDADRKKQRKLFRANYARYAAEAKLKNIQRAAEKLMKEKLAAEKAAAQGDAAQQPQPVPQTPRRRRFPPQSENQSALPAVVRNQQLSSCTGHVIRGA